MGRGYARALGRLNEIYAGLKGFEWDGCKAPEQCPQIGSDQVRALLMLLTESGFYASIKASPPYEV